MASYDYPAEISMGIGSGPECIAIGEGPRAYVTSLKTGEIFLVDLRDGSREVFHERLARTTVGIGVDARRRLMVCGGIDGTFFVLDIASRSVIRTYRLGGDRTFVNDFVQTPDCVYVTDSFEPVLYKLPLGPRGELPGSDDVVRLPLHGDLVYRHGDTFSSNFNSNGISFTPDRSAILIVQTNTGGLFRTDVGSGWTERVDLDGEVLTQGDGLLLEGTTLYVVQNLTDMITVLELSSDGRRGRVVERIQDPRFESPTAMARFGSRFYISGAQFTAPDPAAVDYRIIALDAQ